MAPEITDIIVKLGIGALSIFGMIYVIKGAQREREANQKSFMEYINTNNHQTTGLVKEATQAIIISTEAMKEHTKTLRDNSEITKLMLNSLLNRENNLK